MLTHSRCRPAGLLVAALGALAWGAPAAAAPTLSMPPGVTAVLDLRIVGADGERSWADGGWGRSRFGGEADGFGVDALPVEAELVWRGPLGWDLSGTIAIAAQDGQDQPLDVVEAFVSWRPLPSSATRFSMRAGLFWPAVSLEHEGPAWSVADMITPSAINSWIGEEVKVLGLEATASREFGGNSVAATFALFGLNDTSGTMLAFRGWALHDQKTTLFSHQRLPLLNNFMLSAQAPATRPSIELDGRPGFYGKLSWRMAAPVTLEALYYDNRGDPAAVNDERQWGWRTRFLNLGARIDLGDHTRFLAQALTGSTDMGPQANGRHWVETRFRAAYLRLTHQIGRAVLSGRVDLFDTREQGRRMGLDESEEGRAFTGAFGWTLSARAQLLFEAMHVDSERGARTRGGLAPNQKQNVVQAGIRLTL